MKSMKAKLRLYWSLIKSLQTGLLVFTGLAGYKSARCPIFNLTTIAGVFVSLAAAISGSTILNMWWDRDIDARMSRTQKRPLPSGQIDAGEVFRVGLAIAVSSILTALAMGLAAWVIEMSWGFLHLLGVLSVGLVILAVAGTVKPSDRASFGLFKYASV